MKTMINKVTLNTTFICSIIFFSTLTCQKNSSLQFNAFFPTLEDSPVWTVSVIYSNPEQKDFTLVYKYAYDTSFCNHPYIKVIVESNNVIRHLCYIRVDDVENEVYIRKNNNCNDDEYLLYNFKIGEGQSVICGFNLDNVFPDVEIEFKVIQIDSIYIDAFHRREIRMEYFYNPDDLQSKREMTWVEGIGSLEDPFYSVTLSKAPGAGIHQLNSFKIRNKELLKY